MTKSQLLHVSGAVLVAALAPALAVGVLSLSPQLISLAFLVALGHAVILGVPLVILLWRKSRINIPYSLLSGFGVGAIGVAIFNWPLTLSEGTNAWIGADRIQAIADGVPTAAGWLQYFGGVAFFGALGALGGYCFWLWLRAFHVLPGVAAHNDKDVSTRSWGGVMAMLSVAVIAAGVLTTPYVLKDRSCHNPFRDGRNSIGPQRTIDLHITRDEWTTLSAVLESFAKARGLSFRDNSEDHPDVVTTLHLSICHDRVVISTAELLWAGRGHESPAAGRGVGIHVYEVQSHSDWRHLSGQLVATLEEQWPGQVRFRDQRSQNE